ncbi:MAG: hypothetical protein MI724_05010 [Spirochaetales bacterium]|nr:hypothetical protein [Spirochaetales bacterium]
MLTIMRIYRRFWNDLEAHHLVNRLSDNSIQLTELGFLAGESSISVVSIIRFINYLSKNEIKSVGDPELVVICQLAKELDDVYIPINQKSTKERFRWPNELHNQGIPDNLVRFLGYEAPDQKTATKRAKRAAAALAYISDLSLEKIEEYLLQHMPKRMISGAVRQIADRTCDVLPTVVRIAEHLHPNQNQFKGTDLLLTRLATGANAKMAYLAAYTGTKLTRGDYISLMNADCTSFEFLKQADDDLLLRCITGNTFKLKAIRNAISQDQHGEDNEVKLPLYQKG